jgi:hypothetical protein
MAIVSMADAVFDGIASSAEYNKLIDNIQDLDARLGPVVSGSNANTRLAALEANSAGTRLTALESLTTNTATNGGHGNVQLSTRLGTGVGTTTNVTTGTATAQLTDLRARAAVVEARTTGPVCYAYQTVAQTVSTAMTALTLGAVQVDSHTMWVAGTPTRITCQVAGVYLVSGMVGFAAGATGNYDRRLAQVYKNGVAVQGMSGGTPAFTAATAPNLGIRPVDVPAAPISLSVGDYLEIRGYADQAGTGWSTAVTSGYNPFIAVAYLRPLP